MLRKHINFRLLNALFFLTLISACQLKSKPKQYVIGFSQCVESDAWRKTMLDEMKRELSFHPDVNFIYRQADGNSQRQVMQVKELLEKGIDILIISPNEAEPLTSVVEETYKKNIPVIIVDRKVQTPLYTAYVGGNNYEIGKLAGEYSLQLLKPNSIILEITGLPKSSPAIERHNGFEEALKNHPSIKIAGQINGEWVKERAKSELAKIVQLYPKVDLVFAHNDMMALGAQEVYNEKGYNNKPKIIGIDGLPDKGIEFVEEKLITATMLYPTGGEEAIRIAFKILNGEKFEKENILQTSIIDSTNVRVMQLQASRISSQQKSIEQQDNVLQEQKRMYDSQRLLLYVLVTTLILAIILGGLAFYSLKENRKINKRLQMQNQEISGQKKRIEEISAKAKAASEAKVNFFTNISHEFRTPLTLILGPLEELQANTKNHSTTLNLTLIHKNVIRLLRLINQLMDFRKIEVEKMKVRAVENDIVSFVAEIVQSYKSIAQKRNIDLQLITKERQIVLWFDSSMIDKVVFNLLSNAFKFTKDNGYINVYINKTEGGKEVSIRVEDNGVGMTKEGIENAFDVFYQGEYENYKGSGLGLALSKELVKLHKGKIMVNSEKWKGTTFEIRLPLGNAHFSREEMAEFETAPNVLYEHEKIYNSDLEGEQKINKETPPTTEAKENLILIVEDNPELRSFLIDKLNPEYDILEADSGQSAIQQAFDAIPDLIISDVVIPGKDGMALTNIFKNDIRTSHIPIVLLTAKTSIEQQIEGMRNMADAYITKPFNIQFLKQTIKSLLSNRAMLKEHFTSELPGNLKTKTVSKLDRKFVSEFTSIIESNLSNEDLTVEEICKHLGVSRVQLYRKVKALLNINVNDYILTTRLQKAKYFLQHEDLSISEIAYKVGFGSPAYFSTVFKSKFGVTPKAFKEK